MVLLLCFRNGRDFGVFVCCLATSPGVAIMGGGGKIIIEVFNGSISRLVSACAVPSRAEDQ